MDSRRSLLHVRAAQLRARAARRGLGQLAFASAFLAGALGWARTPERHTGQAVAWTTALLILSSVNVTMGLRLLARVRPNPFRLWPAAAVAWAVLSLGVVSYLLRW